jgi:hypothetical protein
MPTIKASTPSIESTVISQLFAGIVAVVVLILSFNPLIIDISNPKKNMQITKTPQWFMLILFILTKLNRIANPTISIVEIMAVTLEKYNLNIMLPLSLKNTYSDIGSYTNMSFLLRPSD